VTLDLNIWRYGSSWPYLAEVSRSRSQARVESEIVEVMERGPATWRKSRRE